MVQNRDDRDDPDDLPALLDDLRTTLSELERYVDDDDIDRRRPRRRPEPPRASDVVRFTEEYTIPTVIAVLETTIQSLELLRGLLRLADPSRRDRAWGSGPVDRRVLDGTEQALDELRRVLTGTEEPSDPGARDLLADARELTSEIDSILDTARSGQSRPTRSRDERAESRGVVIPVDDENEPSSDRSAEREPEETEPTVDVEAELESIKDEVRRREESGDADDESSDSPEP